MYLADKLFQIRLFKSFPDLFFRELVERVDVHPDGISEEEGNLRDN